MQKLSKRILVIMNKRSVNQYCFVYIRPEYANDGDLTVSALAQQLKLQGKTIVEIMILLSHEGYVEPEYLKNKELIGYRLTYKGMTWRYCERQKLLHYISEKWIDFFALLLSVGALVISIISLMQGQSAQP